MAITVGVVKYDSEKMMTLELEILTLVPKSIIFAEERNVFIKNKLIGFNNELQFCYISVFSIFEIALKNANFEIINDVTICIEM